MNWEIVGALGEWAGAIAVVVTLMYFARQISLAQDQLSAQIDKDVSDRVFLAYDPIYEGRNAKIMNMGLNRPDELDEDDAFVFNLLMYRQNAAISNLGLQILQGKVSSEWIGAYAAHYRNVLLSSPGGLAWFREHFDEACSGLEALGLHQLVRKDA